MIDLKRSVVMLETFEGRDKFSKCIQHLCGILFRLTKNKTKDFDYWNENMFYGLYKQMGTSRQYFRLFKSVQEIKNVIQLINIQDRHKAKSKKIDEFERLLQILIRSTFTMYWIYDNLTLFCKLGLIQKNFIKIQQQSMDFRLYGLVLSLLLHTRNLVRAHHREIQVRQRLPFLKDEHENIIAIEQIKLIKIEKQRNKLTLMKTIGDSFLSFAGTKLADNVLKRIFPKIMVNIGGLVAGMITCYFLYHDQKQHARYLINDEQHSGSSSSNENSEYNDNITNQKKQQKSNEQERQNTINLSSDNNSQYESYSP